MFARLLALLVLWPAGLARAEFPSAQALESAVVEMGGAEVVVFDRQQAGRPTRVMAAGRARAGAAALEAMLRDPATYRRAVPSFRKAEVVRRRGPGGDPDLLVSWELEVPLWNLAGKLWLIPMRGGVDLELVDGDMAPGRLALRVREGPAGTLLTIDGHANVAQANWATRRLAGRSPLAEPAMSAAAIWALLRALDLELGPAVDPRRNPHTAMGGPPLQALDGRALGTLGLAPGLVVAAVRSRADGRLDRVEIAVPVNGGDAASVVAEPARWKALPGWRDVQVSGGRWRVDTALPFVDLDAVWSLAPGPGFRALAVEGDTRGAVMSWDVVAAKTVAVFSSHPRLEKSGYIARKFIEAEPILEHALALGLGYVDAVALLRGAQLVLQ